MRIRLLRRLYLPSCVIAGLVGLAGIKGSGWAGHPGPAEWMAGWKKLPGILINVVFACLFLGVKLPQARTLWRRAGPQVAYGQMVAWGQYVVGVGLVIAVLGQAFGVPDTFGAILPVGFEGGHGTASGLRPTFEKLNWAEGTDLALASATVGIVGAIVFGMILVNWAARRGRTVRQLNPEDVQEDDSVGVIPVDSRPEAGRLTVKSDAIEAFSMHLCVVGLAILIGMLAKWGLTSLETLWPWAAENHLLSSFPLFPLCMIGGLVIQMAEDRFDKHRLIDPGLTRRIQNTALDFLVVAAIATIQIETVRSHWAPLAILMVAGVVWNLLCVLVLAPRVLPDAWFERSIAEMGQSMGVTATGLLLLRVVDPDYETPAADAFACKQLIHEPFMGGGLWTGMALPLLAAIGGLKVFLIALGMLTGWFIVALIMRRMRNRQAGSKG